MKTILLVRHGKSDWSLSQPDVMRTLTEKGKKDVALIAKATKKHLPENFSILCSGAARAISTAKIYCAEAGIPADRIEFRDELYTFSISELEAQIKSTPGPVEALLVFGHNEAFTEFVNKYGDSRIDNLPTSGFAKIVFESDSWKNINRGKTHALVFPKEIRHGH